MLYHEDLGIDLEGRDPPRDPVRSDDIVHGILPLSAVAAWRTPILWQALSTGFPGRLDPSTRVSITSATHNSHHTTKGRRCGERRQPAELHRELGLGRTAATPSEGAQGGNEVDMIGAMHVNIGGC